MAAVLFATERFSVDLVALLVLGALLVTGLVTPQEGVSGFGNPATVTVATMFILSASLQKTGAMNALGKALIRLGKTHAALLGVVMVPGGVLSAFISNTAVVAVFLPLVVSAAAARKTSGSRLLITLSYTAQFGGVCTLIGTSTNLLVSSISQQAGLGAFSVFESSRLGIIMFATGAVYLLLIGRWLVPARRAAQLTETYELGNYISELRVTAHSTLFGKTVLDTQRGSRYDVTVLEILREQRKIWSPPYEPLREGDVLLAWGGVKNLMDLKSAARLEIE